MAGFLTSERESRDVSDEATIRRITEQHAGQTGALLPILHALQERLGYVPEAAVPIVAEVLNLSRAGVHGVVTFYHFFRTSPPGRQTLYVCRAEACQAMGGRALAEHVTRRLGIDFHATTSDGRLSLEPIYCLGNCACAPSIMLDEEVYGRATPALIDTLVENV